MNKHFGTRRPRLLRSLLSVMAVALVAFGLPLVTMSAASAHTPSIAANCTDGITVSGTAYESKDTNTLGIQIDGGAWVTKTFTNAGSLNVPVPQNDALTHSYKAYVHTTNSNPGYSHDYQGQVGPCGKKHVTAVLWEKTPPTCSANGALVPKTEPEGINVTRNPSSGTGPATYHIQFTAKPYYTIDGQTSQTIVVEPKLTGDQCATEVQPVNPTISNPTCTGPGTNTAGSFTLPANGNGITYSKSGNVVTATADATHKFGSLPAGWTPVDAHHATYTVSYTNPAGYPACLEQLPTPVPPVASAPTCNTDGDLVVGTTSHVVTKVDNAIVNGPTHFGPGTHALTYTAAAGYTFASGTTKAFSVVVLPMTLDCPVTPVAPTVTQSVCTGPGTHSTPVVTPGTTPGISYVYDAGTHVVTATPQTGFALANLPAGWVSHDNGTATYLVTLTDPGPCLVDVQVPTPPVATEATCDTDGTLTVTPTEHVITIVDDTVLEAETVFGAGDHTIEYAPAEGYTFPGEVQTSFPIVVPSKTNDCPAAVVSPTVTQSVCTGPGTHSNPVVTPGDVEGDHVSYVYDATTHVVTATPDKGFALANLPTGWTMQENRTATYTVTLTDPGACLVTVVSPPTVTSPTVQVQAPKAHHPALLPNTGGPNQWLALGGLVLLLGGGALVSRERRLRRRMG
jgi:LPXTG-motif cell wall-anchored protein